MNESRKRLLKWQILSAVWVIVVGSLLHFVFLFLHCISRETNIVFRYRFIYSWSNNIWNNQL